MTGGISGPDYREIARHYSQHKGAPEVSPSAITQERIREAAERLVERWLHGDEKHRQWLKDTAIPDIEAALHATRREALEEAARTQCKYCREGLIVTEASWSGLVHLHDRGPYAFGSLCDATTIHRLASPAPKEESR